jgi:Domain of unknown function (DUF3854)
VRETLELFVSRIFDGPLAPEHLADLRKSGLTDETITRQKIRSVPPHMIEQLLGFDPRGVVSAYLIPFPNPLGGWLDHVRLKVFPTLTTERGTVKYLQARGSGVRLFFPVATLPAVLTSNVPVWAVEGEKKSLSVAQLGLPAVGLCGIEGWHRGGTRELLSDFDAIPLRGRLVELVPDGDVQSNPHVTRGVRRFADALQAREARVRLVRLPARAAA